MCALESGPKSGEGASRRGKGDARSPPVTASSMAPLARTPGNSGVSFLGVLSEGSTVPLDTDVPMNSKPPWLDEDLLRKGREFATKYLFAVVSTQVPALAMIFSFQSGLEPLIFTGKSDTPYKAFRRYLSTVCRIMSWYETDFFDKKSEGYRSMAAVRIMHASVFKKMNEASREELRSKTTVTGRETGVWSTHLEVLKKDFAEMDVDESICPFAGLSTASKEHGEFVFVNQLDLAFTQFGFVALPILYPEYFGIHGATKEHLEGYCHLWRCVGYLLGIKDRYNICSGDGLDATRERCRAIVEKWVKPGFRGLTPDWEHMYRCVLEGLNYYGGFNTFGGMIAYLMWVLGIPVPHLRSIMTWMETATFYAQWFIFRFLLTIPGARAILNYILRLNFKRALNVSPAWLQRKKEIIYDYERLSDKI